MPSIPIGVGVGDILQGLLFAEGKALVVKQAEGEVPAVLGERGMTILSQTYAIYSEAQGELMIMKLKGLELMLKESNILRTHVACDDFGKPYEKVRQQLQPSYLVADIVPRTPSKTEDPAATPPAKNASNTTHVRWACEPDDCIDFSQWLRILLKIASVVYPQIHAISPHHALDCVVHEVVVPLHAWRVVHRRPPATYDGILTGLLHAYCPNLWQTYIFYAVEPSSIAAKTTLRYPRDASAGEHSFVARVMSGLWSAHVIVPSDASTADLGYDGDPLKVPVCMRVSLPPSQLRRLARDFSIVPDLVSADRITAILGDTVGRRSQKLANARKQTTPKNTAEKPEKSTDAGGYITRSPPAPAPASTAKGAGTAANRAGAGTANGAGESLSGGGGSGLVSGVSLSFCEFVEVIARVAIEGMQQETLTKLYPTPYAKVAAILSVWGLADPERLEDAKLLHTPGLAEQNAQRR